MSIAIHLPHFEGPLPLLLYLIRKEEMDIFDIDIYHITSQYMEYIRRMKELDLETAGDFVAMAATLIQIKSQMLLPQYNQDGELLDVEDPRKELVNRLLEYQNFQDISKRLYALPLLGRDLWARGVREEVPLEEDDKTYIVIEEGGLFALISHYRRAIRAIKTKVHHVALKTKSIASQILVIRDRLLVGKAVILRDLIRTAEDYRSELLITFLSALELGKMGLVNVFQAEVYGDIHITALRPIEEHLLEHVQEYDSIDSQKVADSLFEEDARDEVKTASLDEPPAQLELGEEEPYADSSASDDDILAAEMEMNLSESPASIPSQALENALNDFDAEAEAEAMAEAEVVAEGDLESSNESNLDSTSEAPVAAVAEEASADVIPAPATEETLDVDVSERNVTLGVAAAASALAAFDDDDEEEPQGEANV